MRIQYYSDLHLDYRGRAWRHKIEEIPIDGDVLVVAGDLADGNFDHYEGALRMLCNRFKHVVMVAGNHDFFRSTREKVLAFRDEMNTSIDNLHWLEDSIDVINGQRFLGCTLWFRKQPGNSQYAPSMPDFHAIYGDEEYGQFREWVYEVNRESIEFLTANLRSTDVVVTHHLPHRRSVDPKFASSQMNRFFLCEMRELIEERQPKLWVHGHAHTDAKYVMGNTWVVCNPWGYPNEKRIHLDESTWVV